LPRRDQGMGPRFTEDQRDVGSGLSRSAIAVSPQQTGTEAWSEHAAPHQP